jgi:hypothetical protein
VPGLVWVILANLANFTVSLYFNVIYSQELSSISKQKHSFVDGVTASLISSVSTNGFSLASLRLGKAPKVQKLEMVWRLPKKLEMVSLRRLSDVSSSVSQKQAPKKFLLQNSQQFQL